MVIKVTPSGASKRCHFPCGTITTIPAFSSIGLRPVLGHDVKRRGTVDDLHDLVAVGVALPWAFAGEFGEVDGAVAVRRQSRKGARPIGFRCLRGASAQHLELGELGIEIEDRAALFPPFGCDPGRVSIDGGAERGLKS